MWQGPDGRWNMPRDPEGNFYDPELRVTYTVDLDSFWRLKLLLPRGQQESPAEE